MSRIVVPNLRTTGLRQFSFGSPVYDRANAYPNLDFEFSKNKNLHDSATGATSLITFQRSAAGGPGTYTDSDGLIKRSAVNLTLYSEQFDNAWWAKTRATISANQAIALDGKQTADKIVEDNSVNTSHFVRQTVSFQPSGFYTYSAYVKAAGRSWVLLEAFQVSVGIIAGAYFDIQNGVAQGLSSAIMTNNLREAEAFLSVNGSFFYSAFGCKSDLLR